MIKPGDLIKIKKNSNGHNYQVGKKYRIVLCAGANGYQADSLDTPSVRGNYIREGDFDLVYDKENVSQELERCQLRMESIKRIKDYLKKKKVKEVDPKIFSILEIIEISSSSAKEEEKIKKIEYLISEYYK